MNDDRVVGFRRRMVFSFDFFTYSILHVLRCGFCFLDSSCCPDITICLVLLFFRFLYGLGITELESGSEGRVSVMLCCAYGGIRGADGVSGVYLGRWTSAVWMSGKGGGWEMLSVMTSRLRFFLSRTIGSGKTDNGQRTTDNEKFTPTTNVTK